LATFRGIESLPAGHYATIRADEAPRVERWWRLTDHRIAVPRKRADRVALFRETLLDATRLRLRTDVDSAISLSGGLDSSMIYAAYHQLLGTGRAERATTPGATTLRPFTVAWPGDRIDEAPAAAALAAHFGDPLTVVAPRPDDFAALARRVIWHQETIPWNAAVLAYHLLYEAIARHGAKVVLEGHGSDEMLAGYPQFSQIAYRDAVRHFRPFRALQYRRSLAFARNVAADSPERPRLFDESFYGTPPMEVDPAPPDASAMRRALHRAWTSQVLPTILRIFDRASMAASVESRAPLLDWRLVTLVFSLPDDDIIRAGKTKWIQREAARAWLPREVVDRRGKNGFAMPLPAWFRSPAVTSALRESLADGTIAGAEGVDVGRFRKLLDDEVQRGFTYSGATALWQAYAYAQLRSVFANMSRSR